MPLEFPALDGRLTGHDAAYAYAITPATIGGPNRFGPPYEGILIDGVVKVCAWRARTCTPRMYAHVHPAHPS